MPRRATCTPRHMHATPCQPWNIGEFSLDKRHFNDQYPTVPLPLPPAGANTAAVWLVEAFNEAMAALPSWPAHQPAPGSGHVVQTVYGRRRLDWFSRHKNGFVQARIGAEGGRVAAGVRVCL